MGRGRNAIRLAIRIRINFRDLVNRLTLQVVKHSEIYAVAWINLVAVGSDLDAITKAGSKVCRKVYRRLETAYTDASGLDQFRFGIDGNPPPRVACAFPGRFGGRDALSVSRKRRSKSHQTR
jgi:hypothetical protein